MESHNITIAQCAHVSRVLSYHPEDWAVAFRLAGIESNVADGLIKVLLESLSIEALQVLAVMDPSIHEFIANRGSSGLRMCNSQYNAHSCTSPLTNNHSYPSTSRTMASTGQLAEDFEELFVDDESDLYV